MLHRTQPSACESTPDAMYFARQGLHNLSNATPRLVEA
jgi:hypothetical protein